MALNFGQSKFTVNHTVQASVKFSEYKIKEEDIKILYPSNVQVEINSPVKSSTKIQYKIGENGDWLDYDDEHKPEIVDNCTFYCRYYADNSTGLTEELVFEGPETEIQINLPKIKLPSDDGVTEGRTVILTKEGTEDTADNYVKAVDYYGQAIDYKGNTQDNNTYRLFYVDFENKYKDGYGTMYLKADYSDSNKTALPNNYTPSDIVEYNGYTDLTVFGNMNQDWKEKDGVINNINEKAAGWLCSPSQWLGYANGMENKTGETLYTYTPNGSDVRYTINYAIGSPSVELYIASYNDKHKNENNTNIDVLGSKIESGWYGYKYSPGYSGEFYNCTQYNALESELGNGMYVTENRWWWLASPSEYNDSRVCGVYGNYFCLGSLIYNLTYGVCPVVSIKPTTIVEANYKNTSFANLADVVKVGDYVNYNADSNGTKTKTGEIKPGVTANQTFTTAEDVKWRVLSVDNATGKVTLMAENPILKTDSETEYNTVTLSGINGYKNVEEGLNTLGSIYGHGKGAESGRSINVDDIMQYSNFNLATQYSNEYSSNGTVGGTRTYTNPTHKYILGEEYNGESVVQVPEGVGKTNNADGTISSSSVTVIQTSYYTQDEATTKASFTGKDAINGERIYNMLFKKAGTATNKSTYWLASNSAFLNSSYCHFNARYVYSGYVDGCSLFISDGSTISHSYAFVPVVTLQANIQTDGKDETTGEWKIITDSSTPKTLSYYGTLSEAMQNAKDGTTIEVLSNTEETTSSILSSDKTLVLDLNGKTINLGTGSIENNGTLTIDGSGKVTSAQDIEYTVVNHGTLIKNGTGAIENSSSSARGVLYNCENAIANLNEGTLESTNSTMSGTRYKFVVRNSGLLTISGATVRTNVDSSYSRGVQNLGSGRLIMTSGEIVAKYGAMQDSDINMATLAEPSILISGGKITSSDLWCIEQYSDRGYALITGGILTGKTYGIVIEKSGVVQIGEDDGTINSSVTSELAGTVGNPQIIGELYGVNNMAGTFNFYDGISKGKTNGINGTVADTPTGYSVRNGTEQIAVGNEYGLPEGTYQTAYLSNIYTVTVNANGGTYNGGTSNTTVTKNYNEICELGQATKTGYYNAAWKADNLSQNFVSSSNLATITEFTGSEFQALGRTYMYTDKISINISAYMDDWTDYSKGKVMTMISCTEYGGWNFEPDGNYGSKIRFAIFDDGVGYKFATSTKTLAELGSGWHVFTATFDGYYARLYIDGDLEGTSELFTSGRIGYNPSNGIFIGAEAAGSETTPLNANFIGKIGYVSITNSAEVKNINYKVGATDETITPQYAPNTYKLVSVTDTNNIVSNGDFESYSIVDAPNGGTAHTWNTTLNGIPGNTSKAYSASGWGTGSNMGVPVPEVGYHAHMRSVNGNMVFRYKTNEDYNGQTTLTSSNSNYAGQTSVTTGTVSTLRWLGIPQVITATRLTAGKTYTITMDVYRVSGASYITAGIHHAKTSTSTSTFYSGIGSFKPTATGRWETLSWTFTLASDYSNSVNPSMYIYGNNGAAGELYIDNVRLQEVTPINKSYDTNYTATELATPTRAGYTFEGWYADSKYTIPITTSSKMNSATAAFAQISQSGTYAYIYAKWRKN